MFDRRAKYAFAASVVILAGCGVGFRLAIDQLNVVLQKESVDLRRDLASIPRRLGNWEAIEDHQLDAANVEALGSDKYLLRRYRRADDKNLIALLQVVYYTGMIDAVPHIPERCFVAGGMQVLSTPADESLQIDFPDAVHDRALDHLRDAPFRYIEHPHPVTGRVDRVYLPSDDWTIRISRFGSPEGYELYAGYFFVANNRLTPSPGEIRALAFNPHARYAYYAKVEVMMIVPPGEGADWFLSATSELIQDMAPHLLRCLPDWAEVTARQDAEAEPSARS